MSSPPSPSPNPSQRSGPTPDRDSGTNPIHEPITTEDVKLTWEVVRAGLHNLYKTQLPRMAAAITYRTLFSLIPVLALSLVIIGAFTSEDQKKDAIESFLDYAGISSIAVEEQVVEYSVYDPTAAMPSDPDVDETFAVPIEGGDDSTARLNEWITDLLDRVGDFKLKTVGFVGVALFIYAALSLFVEVERAFNHIYRTSGHRSLFKRITLYWTVLTLGGLFLLATFVVGERFTSMVASLASEQSMVSSSVTVGLLGYVVTVAISTLLMLILYSTIPNAKVSLRPALAGAFVAAVAWEAGKWGFTQYLSYSTSYSRLYGSLALLPLFMLWIYVTWLIVLFGLQVAYGLQVWKQWRLDEDDQPRNPELVPTDATLAVAAAVARGFAKGTPVSMSALSQASGLEPALASRVLARLETIGAVLRVERTDERATYSLARPPEQLRVADLLEAGQGLARPIDDPAVRERVESTRRAAVDAAGDETLASLLDPARNP